MNVLAHAFITPIEREDIIQLSQNIDEITDKIEDVLLRIYCNNIREMRPDALALVDVVIRSCEETKLMLARIRQLPPLEDAAHPHRQHQQHGRRGRPPVHREPPRACTPPAADPVAIISWREIYVYLEKCADACEHVADTVEGVVMKNS